MISGEATSLVSSAIDSSTKDGVPAETMRASKRYCTWDNGGDGRNEGGGERKKKEVERRKKGKEEKEGGR